MVTYGLLAIIVYNWYMYEIAWGVKYMQYYGTRNGKINLNDNVLYGEADVVYKCDNCIPDSLITKIKNTKLSKMWESFLIKYIQMRECWKNEE